MTVTVPAVHDPLLPPDRPVDGDQVALDHQLRRSRSRWERDVPRWVVIVVFTVFALVVAGLAATRPSGYLTGGPGPVYDVGDRLSTSGVDDVPGGRWLLLTVGYDEISWWELLAAKLRGDTLIVSPGRFGDTLGQRSAAQMAASKEAAAAAAQARLGVPVAVPALDAPGVGGGSGGLVMTLALIDAADPGDLAGGLKVAVTGTVDADGAVGPIGGMNEKATAAAAAGATVLIVPQANAEKATAAAAETGMTVVAVATVDDAVAWLCAAGGTSSLC